MMIRGKWPVALALLFVSLLFWYLVYTQRIVRAFRTNAETLVKIYAKVQEATLDPTSGSAQVLFDLQGIIISSGVPLINTGPNDTVFSATNLPFEADLLTPEGQSRVRDYVEMIDQRNPPVGDEELSQIHYGDAPEARSLRWIPWFQASALLVTALAGFLVIRYQRRAENERIWTIMARELAHQLGTPISSLQGWLEVLDLAPEERPGHLKEKEVVMGIEEDLFRLERISRRFELVGREPQLGPVRLQELAEELKEYIQARLPRLGPGVHLLVNVPDRLPPVRGNAVLLMWALENIVKNALDALAGRGGKITIYAREAEPGWVR